MVVLQVQLRGLLSESGGGQLHFTSLGGAGQSLTEWTVSWASRRSKTRSADEKGNEKGNEQTRHREHIDTLGHSVQR